MKVNLLKLTDEEKQAVQRKLEEIKPTYMRMDSLMSSLLQNGGNNEFEKVRKLAGMKQMIGIQLEVVNKGVYFIRPETLNQLLPSLNQYFSYAEMLVNNAGNRGNVQQQQLQQQFQFRNGQSPLMGNTALPGTSPNMRPNMIPQG